MNTFEGYVGIRLWDGQWADDVIVGLLLVLFIAFALVFRTNYRLFQKMLRDVVYVKERQSLFEKPGGNELVFRNFMIFQALFLCGICLFSIARSHGLMEHLEKEEAFVWMGWGMGILAFFYGCKRCLYFLFALVFTSLAKYKFWKTNYNAIIEAWGAILYIPALWLAFVESPSRVPVLLFVFFYILCRFVIIYKTIRIFYRKSSSFIYITLYLCGLEILPLFFLYEGIIYMYNFIESSSLWH